ncbi:hypothetical protein D9611_007857 [Ephemerocybe angulata]|uniref:Uncharacterized protein n=1 Tax=Ephemerocybe angulata TaxID=980116 RepID=A0A8H5CF63_9AGAR|nr:hypothetical protein D9611_007857 [Tulosesus angulatus]
MADKGIHPETDLVQSAELSDSHQRAAHIDVNRTAELGDPICHSMQEIPGATAQRAYVLRHLKSAQSPYSDHIPHNDLDESRSSKPNAPLEGELEVDPASPLFHHLSQGLALTVGSALGSTSPSTSECLDAFLVPNKVGLTAGARAWSKHAHRSQPTSPSPTAPSEGAADSSPDLKDTRNQEKTARAKSDGWWGRPSGPVQGINERALKLFWKIAEGATWRNLHWLPHQVLVYEVRVEDGYGMRWSQDQSATRLDEEGDDSVRPWIFRGFVEPMMENGHEVGWRH